MSFFVNFLFLFLFSILFPCCYFVRVCACALCVAARKDITEEANQKRLDSQNNMITILVFIIFVTNIFISVMGMERTGLFPRMHF